MIPAITTILKPRWRYIFYVAWRASQINASTASNEGCETPYGMVQAWVAKTCIRNILLVFDVRLLYKYLGDYW